MSQAGIGIGLSKTVNAPALASTPARLIGVSLGSKTADRLAGIRVKIESMIRRTIGPDLITRNGIGMGYRYIAKTLVSGHFGCPKQEAQVFHRIDNYFPPFS